MQEKYRYEQESRKKGNQERREKQRPLCAFFCISSAFLLPSFLPAFLFVFESAFAFPGFLPYNKVV
jgi:hypothetical protein